MEPQETQAKGDPFKERKAPWQEEVWRLARTWAGPGGIVSLGVDIVKVMEYQLLDSLNRIYDGAGRGEQ